MLAGVVAGMLAWMSVCLGACEHRVALLCCGMGPG